MRRWLAVALLVGIGVAQAQTTYRWVDEQGKVHYGDRPPAKAAGKIEERRLAPPAVAPQLPYATRQAMASHPVTLHVSTDCGEYCKKAVEHLRKRGIPFTEKPVETQEELDALTKLAGGAPKLPLLLVGSRHIAGYEETSWNGLLDAAGYPRLP